MPRLFQIYFYVATSWKTNNFLSKTIVYTQIGRYEDNGVRKALYNKFRRKISAISKITLPEYSANEKFIYFNEDLNSFLTSNPRNSIIYQKRVSELKNLGQAS